MIILVVSSIQTEQTEKLAYDDFDGILNGEVQDMQLLKAVVSASKVKGSYRKTSEPNREYPYEVTLATDGQVPDILKACREYKKQYPSFEYENEADSNWMFSIMTSLLPILLLIGVWFFILKQMQIGGSKAMSFGKSRARLNNEGQPKVTFNDVAGCDEAKEELKEIVEFLKDPKRFQKLGGKIPHGVLLHGPPGTGKTLLARAVAGEANVPFFSISGSDFVEMFVGVGASRVRDLFEQGKKHAPCIIFMDEIDAVGRQRFAGVGGGHDEREQTLNQLLVEMDGFNTNEEVILIAATNRPDVLDPALLRPGRFDRQIIIDLPDLNGRKGIVEVHTKNVVVSKDVDYNVLARRTPGFSGADLYNTVNEAALLAARKVKDCVQMEDFEEAIERVTAGPERKSRAITDKEKKIVAYHEAGHAVVGLFLADIDPVHKVSILPRGRALGYTMHLPVEDRYLTTKKELLSRMTTLLGGRVAEDIIFHDVTTGAQNDLERVTDISHKMVCNFGMSEKLGPLTFGLNENQIFLGRDFYKDREYSEEIQFEIDKEVRQIVDECYHKAKRILEENRDILDSLANALLEREVLLAEEVKKLVDETEAKRSGQSEANGGEDLKSDDRLETNSKDEPVENASQSDDDSASESDGAERPVEEVL
ncbi:MAG: ATP-dependent zinc metalloprotease FtsH [Candidatus Omnitrophica bacterium]|nr:ATP-dependent zinc metalloprotease FtsH [Candidatus Omnitrophota bacterium]